VAAELALGVLTGRERAMAVAHLDSCDTCREDVRQLMATGEQLLELLPAAEPSAGFETRVLERLGMPVPPPEPVRPGQRTLLDRAPWLTEPAQGHGHARPGRGQPGGDRPRGGRPPHGKHGGARRPGRMRRALAAAAVGVAVIAAGLGGWRIGVGTAPAAADDLASASLLTAADQSVGSVFIYTGTPRWLFMSVDMGSGNQWVTCQLVGADGRVSTVARFQLADGRGSWGIPAKGNIQDVRGAQLVSDAGTVLARATFNDW